MLSTIIMAGGGNGGAMHGGMMAGAPRNLAISIGTLAAAVGLGLQLWIPGLLIWLLGHSAAVFLARRDPDFMATLIRALRHKEHLSC